MKSPVHVILSEAKNRISRSFQSEILRFAQNDMDRRPFFSSPLTPGDRREAVFQVIRKLAFR